ncbi:MAG: hypothetical protein AAGA48_17530 [Myxococcota bacterium]
MPKWAIDAIAAIAGIAVGVGLAMTAGPAGEDCREEFAARMTDHTALNEQVAQVEAETERLRGQLVAREGEVLDWPENAGEAEAPEQFEGHLASAVEAAGAEKMNLDCSEYPCLATVRFGEGVDGDKGLDKVTGSLKKGPFAGYDVLSGGTALADPFPNGPERAIRIFAVVPVEGQRPKGTSQRLSFRINSAVRDVLQKGMNGGAQ